VRRGGFKTISLLSGRWKAAGAVASAVASAAAGAVVAAVTALGPMAALAPPSNAAMDAGRAATLSDTQALLACPSPKGLVPFTAHTKTAADHEAATFDRVSLTADLHISAQSWWPQVREMWKAQLASPDIQLSGTVRPGVPLAQTAYSVLIPTKCGRKLVADSLMVTLIPLQQPTSTGTELFFLNRDGRALVYFVYP
jgi:hypothetical protein